MIINLDSNVVFLAKESLKAIKKAGINRKLMGVKIDTNKLDLNEVSLVNKK